MLETKYSGPPLGDDNCGHIRQVAAGEGDGIKGDHCIAYYMYML